jgi:short-subunit dehydrogenase
VSTSIVPAVVITGASSGIGQAVATALARHREYQLILQGRNEDALRDTALRCEALGSPSMLCPGDLTSPDTFESLRARLASLPHIAALVNNAGAGAFGPTDTFPESDFSHLMRLNVEACFRLTKLVLGSMRKSRAGTIVNISSDADTVGFAHAAAYCASKGALLMMTRALREELRPAGIRVCSVSPGRVDTCFNGKRPGMRPGALSAENVAEVVEFVIRCDRNLEIQEVRLDSMSRHAAG